jgi:hypothetical protein
MVHSTVPALSCPVRHSHRPANGSRAAAIVLALLAHMALLWLFIAGGSMTRTQIASQTQFVSVWLEPASAPVLAKATPKRSPPVPSSRSITMQVPAPPTTLPQVAPAPAGPVDWQGELAGAAARAARPAPRTTFSAPPKALKPACTKKKSSMEWNGKEDRRVGLAGGIFPYVRLGRCVVGLGFFGCPLGAAPEANSHLLDDMKEPEYKGDSVPDPDECE